ncbi:MAG TPA: carboxypeptidase-like regulatory domain-containing protein, partial [Planctomycetota bacterium]|nr:carboxypeptidase-like regulatory domain-containing protein [Planctomycetota bacterium]
SAGAVQGPGTVATRTEPMRPNTEGLADAPTACLQVVDHATMKPIAGAAVRRVQGGAEIGFTDERGLAGVPLADREQLAVVSDGYLLRLVPTRLGSTEAEPQQVLLVRDVWSWRRSFLFVDPGGTRVAEAFVRFRPREPSPARSPVPAGDALLQRAWTEHTMLAGRPVCDSVPVQLGSFAENRVHRLGDDAEVRFACPGVFTLEVATTNGLVGSSELRIEGAAGAAGEAVRMQLVRGETISGLVTSAVTSQPLAQAELSVQGGEPLGLVATTAADGAFAIGPLLPGRVTLNVHHGDCEPQAVGPLTAPAAGVRIALQPLPQTSLRGRVRSRPDLTPLAGATIVWSPGAGAPVTATSKADGTFVLPATGTTAAKLLVQAPGHRSYAELVEPGSPFADYDLWPGTPAARLEKGLSSLLQGAVVDAEGRPVANAIVRWHPVQQIAPGGIPGRRVLEGGTLELPLVTTTGADGAFALETTCFGPGKLTLVGAETAAGRIDVQATAGKTINGLRLQQ